MACNLLQNKKNMNKHIVRHGEVVLKQVDSLPKGAELIEESNKYMVAHSETGHHHILEVKDKVDMSKIKVYMHNGERYLEVPEMSELWHQKSGSDVHTPHKIVPGIYKINIKKHFDYFKGAMEAVRD